MADTIEEVKVTIRLDSERPYSPCSGDRTPDDPHYAVAAFQGLQGPDAFDLAEGSPRFDLVSSGSTKVDRPEAACEERAAPSVAASLARASSWGSGPSRRSSTRARSSVSRLIC